MIPVHTLSVIVIMFNHLFNTYEVVIPPKFKEGFNKEIYYKPEKESKGINTFSLGSISNIPGVERPSDLSVVSDTSTRLTTEEILKNQNDPFLTNYDLLNPAPSMGEFSNKSDFIKALNEGYRRALSSKGLDPDYSYVLTAQAALESGWGKHVAGKYNFGGIKITDKEAREHPERAHRVLTTDWSSDQGYFKHYLNFRNFSSIDDYCNYKVDLLSNKRYDAFNSVSSENPYNFVFHILSKGYGSDYGGPESRKYVASVMKIYNSILDAVRM